MFTCVLGRYVQVQCCFTSTETIRNGKPRKATSTFTRLLSSERYDASTFVLVPNLSEGADSVGGQLRGDKECPFSGVTSSGRVWRKVPESDARSVGTNKAVKAI